MKTYRFYFMGSLLFLAFSCSGTINANSHKEPWVLVGSTPGDAVIKSILAISEDIHVDFIRWHLSLSPAGQQAFTMNINYGMAQQNTLGFTNGGQRRSIQGTYTIDNIQTKWIRGRVYRLKSDALPGRISLLQLNENIFHLLTPGNRMLAGNGGWSYTLNRESPAGETGKWYSSFTAPVLFADTALQVTFDGRTPCRMFMEDQKIQVIPDCMKLKWRLILYRDAQTGQPTTYSINRTMSRQRLLTGTWAVKKHPAHEGAWMVQLDPDQPDRSTSLLLGNQDILFFLDKDLQPYVGNKDFSYTLNRMKN